MKKRIEKVVEWTEFTQKGKREKVFTETEDYYSLLNDDGVIYPYPKEYFKVVSEKEVLEFEGLSCYETLPNIYATRFESEIDLTKYNIKVIATPKDKTYEEMSKEELIKLLKAKE